MAYIRPIANYPGYFADSDGIIWSAHNNKWGIGGDMRQLRPGIGRYHRMIVCLKRADGIIRTCYVHHLILEAFVGRRPVGMEARHLNGDAGDNRAVNLQWGTHAENMRDMARHGRKKGERHHQAKLNDAVVRTIRTMVARGDTHQSIADALGIQRRNVGRVADRSRWSHVV